VQRVGYALVGPVQRLFQHIDASPGEYGEADISPYFWHNGAFPTTDEYRRLFDESFTSWRLKIGGRVDNPVVLVHGLSIATLFSSAAEIPGQQPRPRLHIQEGSNQTGRFCHHENGGRSRALKEPVGVQHA
jgi:hypothetical protein